MSLRKTDLIRVPQRPPPTNKLCQYTHYGFAPDIRSRAACEHSAEMTAKAAKVNYGKESSRSCRGVRVLALFVVKASGLRRDINA